LGGKEKDGRDKESPFGEERWTYTCRAKKAFAVDEGSLGGAEESCAQVIWQDNRSPRLADSFTSG